MTGAAVEARVGFMDIATPPPSEDEPRHDDGASLGPSRRCVTYRVDDSVAWVTLNRPESRNALGFALRRELVDALREAEADDDVSLVVIDAAGTSFSSGYDMAQGDAPLPDGWVRSAHFDSWTDQFARSCLRDWLVVWDLLKPVVAKVHGYCLAGGTELMSMCDIVFAADDAVIGYPPSRGMSTPDVPFFPWKVSMARAKYLQITGNTVSGREAAAMGWIAKSFPADELDAEVAREVAAIAHIAPDLLATSKASLNLAYETMGMRTALQSAWQMHLISAHHRPRAGDFEHIATEQGLRAALRWENGPFQDAGLGP